MRLNRYKVVLAMLLALSLVAAACGGGTSDDDGTTAAPGGGDTTAAPGDTTPAVHTLYLQGRGYLQRFDQPGNLERATEDLAMRDYRCRN